MKYLNFRVLTILTLTTAFILTSCRKKEFIRPGDSLPVAYDKSKSLYDEGKYKDAVSSFEIVLRIGRGTDYGKNAQFYLADSYYQDEDYLLAASEFERYISLYPGSERRKEAAFKEANCYYELSPRYKLDQKYTRRAIEKFNLFEARYPDSDSVRVAAEKVKELRAKLARKLYNAADLYMRVDQYEAATIYYDLTIDQYPETAWAERALVNQINAYVIYADNSVESKQEERYQKAVNSYEKYLQLFPTGEFRSKADQYVDKARVALSDIAGSEATASNTTSTDTAGTASNNSPD